MDDFHSRSLLTFAHRGGAADYPANSIEAFENAIKHPVTGVETDAWQTADGIVVLDHDGFTPSRWSLRRKHISTTKQRDLPPEIPTLADLYKRIGDQYSLFVDIKDGVCAPAVVHQAKDISPTATSQLYLAHLSARQSDWRMLASWRSLDPDMTLVDSTQARLFDIPLADYAKRDLDAGITVINLHARDWTQKAIDTIHEAGLRCFAFHVNSRPTLERLKSMGIDAVFSDYVGLLSITPKAQS